MLDAFTMARLRRFADPAAFPSLSFGAAPIAPAPQPWTRQSEVFDEAIANGAARAPALVPADAAFSPPRGAAFSPIDFGEQPMADAPWHRRQPFVFEPIDTFTMARLARYSNLADLSGAAQGNDTNASPVEGQFLARLARYRQPDVRRTPAMGPASRLSDATREKIADVESFYPPKTWGQEWAEQLLVAQNVAPAGWRFAEPVGAYWEKDLQSVGGVPAFFGPWLFVGPDGEFYETDPDNSAVLIDEYSATQKGYDEQRHAQALFDWWDSGAPLEEMPPEIAAEIVLAMAAAGRWGPRGAPLTELMATELVRKLLRMYPGSTQAGGGYDLKQLARGIKRRVKEKHIPGYFNSLLRSHRTDATVRLPGIEDNFVHGQIPRVDANGHPTKRELDTALDIAKRGHQVHVWDRADLRRRALRRLGANAATIKRAKIDE